MEDRIKKVMRDVFNIDIASIGSESSPDNIENWDSLKHMNLIVALEEEFDAEIPDDQAEAITTVKQAVAFIEANDKG